MTRFAVNRIAGFLADGDTAQNSDNRGAALESLIIYLFSKIPGVRFEDRDVITAGGSEEIDVVLWNDKLPEGLHFLPNVLLFECKNWGAPVGSHEVGWFIQKLSTKRLDVGFLIASNGVTGDPVDQTAAYNQISTALSANGIRLVVINRTEISALRTSDQLVRLLQRKIALTALRAAGSLPVA